MAAKHYKKNLDRLGALIGAVNKIWEPIEVGHNEIAPHLGMIAPGDEHDKKLNALLAAADAAFATVGLAFSWYLVMLVTYAEAFFQDILAAAAKCDGALMERSEAAAKYREVIEATSIESLGDQLRQRWAKGIVDDGGPKKWSEWLRKQGMKQFDPTFVARLEEIWGMRHVVVHRAGRLDADFVKRHPNLGYKEGQELALTKDDVLDSLATSGEFVRAVDEYFTTRVPDLESHGAV